MLTPTQIIEQMLKQVAEFDAAHTPGSLDNSILRTEANSIFRVLRTIEETSGQRFLLTATGSYLDLIGAGMSRLRLSNETDEQYRTRLIFNPNFWNDCTVSGIKEMIKTYYGIDMEQDGYDETRLLEPYRQAASFFNKEKTNEASWENREGWVDPSSDFGAEWLNESTSPGAIEVHLRAFQDGEERFIKKREVKDRLMEVRAAGIVVFLYFHMSYGADTIPPMVEGVGEVELIQKEKIATPKIYENFEVMITDGEISSIVADARDIFSGKLSRRIVHDRQMNRCQATVEADVSSLTAYEQIELDNIDIKRPEPFKFRSGKLRNRCWSFFYGIKYEERDVNIPEFISIPIKALINEQSVNVGLIEAKDANTSYIVMEISGNKGNRKVDLSTAKNKERYTKINSIIDLQEAMVDSKIGTLKLKGANFYASISQSFRKQYKKEPVVNTYYTRPNPMVDEQHHARCEDTHGLDFYSIVEYVDFWWRVSTTQNGVISMPSIPYKLTVAKTTEGTSDLWWRVTTYDGQEISIPGKPSRLELIGQHAFQQAPKDMSIISSWTSAIEELNLIDICQTRNELVLLDSYNPNNKFEWKRSDIASIKTSYTPERLVFSNLNICELPINDPYYPWVDLALHAGITINDTKKIRFWDDAWYEFLTWRIDKIIKSGFSGIVFDGLVAWCSWGDIKYAKKMRELVVKLKNYIAIIRGKQDFFVLIKNQEDWHIDSVFLNSLDGIVATDVFDLNVDPIASKVNDLNVFLINGKSVFVFADYNERLKQEHFVAQTSIFNFIPSLRLL